MGYVSGNDKISDVRGIKSIQEVEMLREKVYGVLEDYTRATHPNEPGRFAKLLLRLPALRSIALKCMEELFYFKIGGDVPFSNFAEEVLPISLEEYVYFSVF